MNIIFFESAQNFGGARIATVDLAHRLSSRHKCTIIDTNGTSEPFVNACQNYNLPLIILQTKIKKPMILSNGNLIDRMIKLLKYIPQYFSIRKSLARQLEAIDADCICVNSLRTLSYLYRLYPKVKVVYFAHGWYIKSQISRLMSFLFKHTVDCFICGSEATRHALYSCGIADLSKLNVLHIGIEKEKLRKDVAEIKTQGENCIKILHSAGFTKGKGQLISIEVAKQLKDKGVNFKLILTGIIYAGNESKRYFDIVKEKIEKYDLGDYVELVVGLPNVIHYFNACDILIHPSDTEGLGMVVMEAMILKKPVIANPVGGIIDMILHGYTGFLTRYNNVDDYVRYIQLLSNDMELKEQIVENAFKLISTTFTVDQQIVNLERILSNE